jgi:hypothetical protein
MSEKNDLVSRIWKSNAAVLPLVWVGLSTLVLFWFFHDWGVDDPYITFRYARNIATGAGFVYNPGQPVLSTTTPLYALILALCHFVGLDIALCSIGIGCISLALGSLVLWKLGQDWNTPLAGGVGMLLFPMAPLLALTISGETMLYVTLILYGFLACARKHYDLAALLLALATLTRADGAVAAGTAGIYVLLTQRENLSWRRLPWRSLLIYVLMLIPWFAFAWLYFGDPLPVTLAAKQQQTHIPGVENFFMGLVSRLQRYWNDELLRWHLLLSVAGALYMLRYRPHWLLIVGWSILYMVAYTILGVSSYFWYYAPVAVMLVVLTALGVEAFYMLLQRLPARRWQQGLSAMLVGAVILSQGYNFVPLKDLKDDRMAIYREVGTWLQQHTPPDARVGTIEVGIIGYYSRRHMIDFAGLLQPDVAQLFSSTQGYNYAARWAFQHFHPTYLVLQDQLFATLEQDPTFIQRCQRIRVFHEPAYRYPLVVYQCHW